MTKSPAMLPAILVAVAVTTGAATVEALPSPMVHPNLARGDDGVFESFAHDRVNLFNGNLRVDIPIGQSYPLSSRFSYRLVLSYNSNAWDLTQNPDGTVAAHPMALSNAGMGWDLSLGRLIAPAAPGNSLQRWIYVAPDGQASPFYDRLHHDEAVSTVAANVFYSRDGTYLRLRRTDAYTAVVEMPNGTSRTFAFDSAANTWRLTSVADPFGNALTITYGVGLWTLSDSHGRTHRVYFEVDSAGSYGQLVDRVELAAFSGAIAKYQLSYGTKAAGVGYDTDPSTPPEVPVPLLQSLSLPDGSLYAFAYPGSAARLGSMTLPTLGRIQWSFVVRPFQAAECNGALPAVLRSNTGVTSRTTVKSDGTIDGTWDFHGWFFGATPSPACHPYRLAGVQTPSGDFNRYFFTVDSVGAEKGNYGLPTRADQKYPSGQALSEAVYDCQPGGASCPGVRYIYRRFEQDAPADPAAFDGTQRNRREAALRTTFADDPYPGGGLYYADINRFEFDGLGHYRRSETRGNFGKADFVQRVIDYDAATGNYPGAGWSKPEPSAPWVLGTFRSTKTSDGTTSEVVDYCYDKVTGAELRRRLRLSATSPTAKDVIMAFVHDAAGNVTDERFYGGDVQAVAAGTDLCVLALPSADVYRVRHSSQYGVRNATWFANANGSSVGFNTVDRTIDRNTGLPSSRRDVAGLQTTLQYDALGRLTWEKPQAGGGAWVRYTYSRATGSQQVGEAQKLVREELSNGGGQVLSRSISYVDGLGRPWIDSMTLDSTQAVHRARAYDAMGRLAAETEGWAAWGQWLASGKRKDYLDPDPFGRPRRIVHADGKEETIAYYGPRRRVHTFSRGYYHGGWNNAVVEMLQSVETIEDRQGRVWKVLKTRYTDEDWDGPPKVDTTEYRYDLAGRQTAEVDLVTGQTPRTWTYDARGFLVQADQELPGYYGYCNRLTVDYGQYDPLGNAGSKTTTRPTVTTCGEQRSRRIYDRAGRLLTVMDPVSGYYKWREYVYGTANGTDAAGNVDWRRGRLVDAVRHSVMRNASHYSYWQYWGNVKQTYTYAGTGGRVSRLGTSIFANRHPKSTTTYTQDYSYDDLGRATQWKLTSGQGEPGYTVAYTYDWDTLESVRGTNHLGTSEPWIVSQQHHADGGLARAERGNGVTEVIADDGTSIARPGRATLQGMERWDDATGWQSYTWDSGSHQYDGSGALVRRGAEYFVPAKWELQPSFLAASPVNPCWEHCVDPEDLLSLSWEPGDTWWLFDHSGSVALSSGNHQYRTIRDHDGRVVWQHGPSVTEKLGSRWYTWNQYVIYVYAENQLVGEVSRKVWEGSVYPDEAKHRHHHRDTPVITDGYRGRWINDPEN